MKGLECIAFLQSCLPRMHLKWEGFRKVRKQVCRRIEQRIGELGLADAAAYRVLLETDADEWEKLDSFCQVTISRFYRGRELFQSLQNDALPELCEGVISGGEKKLRCWCIGSASGEEPYTIAIIWNLMLRQRFPMLDLTVIATETKQTMIERAKLACYPSSSLTELPAEWITRAFTQDGNHYCVRKEERDRVVFFQQDVRKEEPEGLFHLILCRNLAFTYFDDELQKNVVERLREKLHPGGFLVIGAHESLPSGVPGFTKWSGSRKVFRKA